MQSYLIPFTGSARRSCCDIAQVHTRRLPSCQLEIPAIKVKTVALIGPDKFLANIFALFLRPNSFLLQSR